MTTKHRAEVLADELDAGLGVEFYEENTRSWKKSKIIEAATMLRQQQSEIAELKSEIKVLKSGGEAVAWMFVLDGCRNVTLDEDASDETRHNGIPLYTHQAKTLTDEEYKPLTEADAPYQKVAPKKVADAINTALGLKTLPRSDIVLHLQNWGIPIAPRLIDCVESLLKKAGEQ